MELMLKELNGHLTDSNFSELTELSSIGLETFSTCKIEQDDSQTIDITSFESPISGATFSKHYVDHGIAMRKDFANFSITYLFL